jgi:uncharacterized protein (DUF2126 family)
VAAVDAIRSAGRRRLIAGDVRLTMGGEPTFVSVGNMEGEEWNIDMGAPTGHGRHAAARLVEALRTGWRAHGQGKWYPGEPLPRWALSCFWRADGAPLWHDPALLAEESSDNRHGLEQAERFIAALAIGLGLAPDLVVPGHEDVFYYLWKEGTLPVNVDPLQADLTDADERQRLAALLRRGLGTVTGYALPLGRRGSDGGGEWCSSRWSSGARACT